MLNKLRDQVKILEKNEAFEGFKNHHPKAYMTTGFVIISDLQNITNHDWQIDYYDPDEKMMHSFIFHEGSIEIKEPDKLFQKVEKAPVVLDLEKCQLNVEQILNIIYEDNEKENRRILPAKIVCIIQNMDGKEVYNMSIITMQFSVLNARVDANTGEIIKINLQNIMNFGSIQPGSKK